ncbi:ISL3 family transposase [Methylobacterium terricola]|uniref:ISL3 family transposase n=1 Tax=Methylobacterium terricola TaxID=2583531 RepID=A0A5C4L8L7_9HYPH|nr:ISL3 family transposase [Methylobacterium terricola]
MNIPFAISECRVARFVERHEDHLVIPMRLDAADGRCPDCGRASWSVHSRYHRQPVDLPVSTSQTRLRIEGRRFYCLNPTCRRRTFAEAPLSLRAPGARGGLARRRPGSTSPAAVQAGARLFAHLHTPASRAAVLRLVTRLPMPDALAPIRVGIDDWAIRKGCRYGTIVVDLDRHRVVDLLSDHTAPTVAGWLERQSGVALVARDRSTEYARGASLGAPQAQQVADRWHLLTTMRQAVERGLHGAHARLRILPPLPGSAVRPTRRDHAIARSTPELEAGAQSRIRWQALHDGPSPEAQGPPIDFVRSAEGEALGEGDAPRHFVGGEVQAAERDDACWIRGAAVLEHEVGLDGPSPVRIGRAHHAGQPHGRMRCNTSSTSLGHTLKPLALIMRFSRSTT